MAYIIEVGGWIEGRFGLRLRLVATTRSGWHWSLVTGSAQEDRGVGSIWRWHVGVLFWRAGAKYLGSAARSFPPSASACTHFSKQHLASRPCQLRGSAQSWRRSNCRPAFRMARRPGTQKSNGNELQRRQAAAEPNLQA